MCEAAHTPSFYRFHLVMSVEEDLEELEEILQDPKVVPFLGHVREGTFLRKQLVRFTLQIYLFPVAFQPDLRQPVEIYQNGIGPLSPDDEYQLVPVGPEKMQIAVVFSSATQTDDNLQARYIVARTR